MQKQVLYKVQFSSGNIRITAFKTALAALAMARVVGPCLVFERVDLGDPTTGSRWVASCTGPVGFNLGITTWINLVGAAILSAIRTLIQALPAR